jgi:multiple sugar transport system ATP-binding protein
VAAIEFHGVGKVYPDGTRAVESLDLEIKEKEFMVFVGPSGCGKTTALRMVAGLEEISEGEILIGGRVVNEIQSKDRDVAMVFQNYALYPHMTVAQNLAFGLKLRKFDKAEVRRRVSVAAATLGLEDYLDRKPSALSGGQRQRVAMGRAIVREPHAYVMDEPLSNLDAQLRVQVRAEIQKLQRTLGVTTIYVTHDQTEAMTMGDRIAVMCGGTLQQVDAPEQVYRWPVNRFVAGFIGSPAMNMVKARLTHANGDLIVSFGQHSLVIGDEVLAVRPALRAHEGGEVVLGIRPEDLEDAAFAANAPERTLTVVCTLREALGAEVLVHFGAVDDGSSTFIARVDQMSSARIGEPIQLVVDTSRLHFFEPASGLAIYGGDRQLAAA